MCMHCCLIFTLCLFLYNNLYFNTSTLLCIQGNLCPYFNFNLWQIIKWHGAFKSICFVHPSIFSLSVILSNLVFIRPSSDGTYYGMVMSVRPSVRLSGSPSVRLSVRPSGSPSASFPHFSPTCFDILS